MTKGLIISIEGIPYSGKSTLQNSLLQKFGGILIPPLWEFGGGLEKYVKLPKTHEEIREREVQILQMNLKMLEVADKARREGKLVYLHQTHVSSFAFTYAYSIHSQINTLLECVSDYFDLIYEQVLRLPDLYIFLVIPFKELSFRYKNHGRFINPIWTNEKFVENYTRFYYLYTVKVEGAPTFHIDGQKSANDIFSEAVRIIEDFETDERNIIDRNILWEKFEQFIKSF